MRYLLNYHLKRYILKICIITSHVCVPQNTVLPVLSISSGGQTRLSTGWPLLLLAGCLATNFLGSVASPLPVQETAHSFDFPQGLHVLSALVCNPPDSLSLCSDSFRLSRGCFLSCPVKMQSDRRKVFTWSTYSLFFYSPSKKSWRSQLDHPWYVRHGVKGQWQATSWARLSVTTGSEIDAHRLQEPSSTGSDFKRAI